MSNEIDIGQSIMFTTNHASFHNPDQTQHAQLENFFCFLF